MAGFKDFVHRPEFQKLWKTFRKLDLSAFSGEGKETPTVMGHLERPALNHWTDWFKIQYGWLSPKCSGCFSFQWYNYKNSVVWVREWTIPTERPPLVGEASANFCWQRVPLGQCDESLRPYSRISRPERYFFFQITPQLYSRGRVDPVRDPLLLRKSGSAGNRTRTSGSAVKNSDD
jgi:hypothetical protein